MSPFLEYDVKFLGLRALECAGPVTQVKVGLHEDVHQPRMVDVWLYPSGTARCEPSYYEPVMQEGLLTAIREVFYA